MWLCPSLWLISSRTYHHPGIPCFPSLSILFGIPGWMSACLMIVVSFSTTGTCSSIGWTLPWIVTHATVMVFFMVCIAVCLNVLSLCSMLVCFELLSCQIPWTLVYWLAQLSAIFGPLHFCPGQDLLTCHFACLLNCYELFITDFIALLFNALINCSFRELSHSW